MDRRQRKTRTAIFEAFLSLLSKKDFNSISVQEIIDAADVGRATFYAHFETKDFLLKQLCEELFAHIGTISQKNFVPVGHFQSCTQKGDLFLHLLSHLNQDDNHIMALLTSPNNDLFLRYFKNSLKETVERSLPKDFKTQVNREFLINHITSSFVETVLWWAQNGKKETPKTVTNYLETVLGVRI